MMDLTKTNRKAWLFFSLLLFAPFLIEIFIFTPITINREPQEMWVAVNWIFSYIFYGTVCLIYFSWRKKTGCKIILRPNKHDLKWVCFSIIIGVFGRYAFDFVFGLEINLPMIYREFYSFVLSGNAPAIWLGIVAFVMQYIYYLCEFILIAFMVDCSQKLSLKLGWTQRIPWGGLFLVLTWGFIHPWGLLQGEFVYALRMIFLCLCVGLAYNLPGKKPTYAFLTVMAWYWF